MPQAATFNTPVITALAAIAVAWNTTVADPIAIRVKQASLTRYRAARVLLVNKRRHYLTES